MNSVFNELMIYLKLNLIVFDQYLKIVSKIVTFDIVFK